MKKETPAVVLYLADYYPGEYIVKWQRSETGSVGPFDLRLQRYRLAPEDSKLFAHVKERVKHLKYQLPSLRRSLS